MMRARTLPTGVVACALAWLAASGASADTVTLAASADNTIYGEDGTLSNGAGDHLFVGRTKDAYLRRALLRFDVAGALPDGATVTGVTLTLYNSRTRSVTDTVSLHRVTARWGEGTSDAPMEEGEGTAATASDATWTHRLWDTTTWATAGGDYEASASASTAVGDQDRFYSWSSAGMVSDVQGWLDTPSGNHGWILIGEETLDRHVKRFDSRTNPNNPQRPALTVVFDPPPSTGACCATDGTCSVVLHPGGSCSGTYQGGDTVCSPNPCPPPEGACCLPEAAATCVSDTEAGCGGRGGTWNGALTECSAIECPVVLVPFVDPLPRPAVATPTDGAPGGTASYGMAIRQVQQQLHRDLPPTTVWGFDDGTGTTYPGPTIEARRGEPVEVTWLNDLRDASGELRSDHYLPVDSCPHGAELGGARTVVHLHGGHVPAAFDGHPDDAYPPGEMAVYQYPNDQEAGTLWYHDHAIGITRLNVYMGLAGLYLVRDSTEEALGLPSGEHEVPLVIQDRSFEPDGSLSYPSAWQEHFFGDTTLVNGKVWPYLEVDQGKYRFRVLNGSNARHYTLTLSNGGTFQQIGTDGGLLDEPVELTELSLGPGERADVVIDFAGLPAGTEVDLVNSAPAPYPGTPGTGVVPEVIRFVVGTTTGHTDPLPTTLRSLPRLAEEDAVEHRDFVLEKGASDCGGSAWLINGLGWEDITETPALGTTEVWRFVNRSGVSHPMHMHLVFFQVLDRQPFELVDGVVETTGPPVPVAPQEAGPKDTVQVSPYEIVRVIARFEDYVGRFPYHCHILEHEDHEMMRQFETTTSCGDGALGMPDEECDDGNTDDGDGCSATCTLEPPPMDAGTPDAGGPMTDAGPVDAGVTATDGGGPTADAGRADAGEGGGGGDDGCTCTVDASPIRSLPWSLAVLAFLLWSGRRDRRE